MRRVPAAELEPGMKLAQDIRRSDGMLLAGQGTELSPGVIGMVRRMIEIEAILVEGASFASEEELQAWRKEELRKLVHRFSKVAGDPFMDRLRKLEAKRIMDTQ